MVGDWCGDTLRLVVARARVHDASHEHAHDAPALHALGAEIEVPTLAGKARIRIPAGTQAGTVFQLKGKGVKNVQGYGTGDLRVRVHVEVPTHLNTAQSAKLQEFAELCDENVNPQSKSFFARAKDLFR